MPNAHNVVRGVRQDCTGKRRDFYAAMSAALCIGILSPMRPALLACIMRVGNLPPAIQGRRAPQTRQSPPPPSNPRPRPQAALALLTGAAVTTGLAAVAWP